jgi:hypothetical protein
MKTGKLCAVSVLLFASVIPVFGNAGLGGPKRWFRSLRNGPTSSHQRNNHLVVKHQRAKHPKPHHARNLHR